MDMLPAGDDDFDSDVELEIDVGQPPDDRSSPRDKATSPLSAPVSNGPATSSTNDSGDGRILEIVTNEISKTINHQLQHLTPPPNLTNLRQGDDVVNTAPSSSVLGTDRPRKKRSAPTGGKTPLGREVGDDASGQATQRQNWLGSAHRDAKDLGVLSPMETSGLAMLPTEVTSAEEGAGDEIDPGQDGEGAGLEAGGNGTDNAGIEGVDVDVGGSFSAGEGGDAVSLRTAADIGDDTPFSLGDFRFTTEETMRMARRYPTLSVLPPEYPVPLLAWLTHELGMGLKDMRSLVMRHPRLIAYRVKSHVEPKTAWLSKRLGLGQQQLRKLVLTYPAVLSRSVNENLEPKIKWLEERLGATPSEVEILIKRFPMIFGYSTKKNLEPTVAFFIVDMNGQLEEVKSTIMSCPAILSRSLEKRIIPRTNLMRARDIIPAFGTHKWVVTTYTDAQFQRWLDGINRRAAAVAKERETAAAEAGDAGGEAGEGDEESKRKAAEKRLEAKRKKMGKIMIHSPKSSHECISPETSGKVSAQPSVGISAAGIAPAGTPSAEITRVAEVPPAGTLLPAEIPLVRTPPTGIPAAEVPLEHSVENAMGNSLVNHGETIAVEDEDQRGEMEVPISEISGVDVSASV